jgi:hypothetical protein
VLIGFLPGAGSPWGLFDFFRGFGESSSGDGVDAFDESAPDLSTGNPSVIWRMTERLARRSVKKSSHLQYKPMVTLDLWLVFVVGAPLLPSLGFLYKEKM